MSFVQRHRPRRRKSKIGWRVFYLAVLALPNEVGLASATALFVLFLCARIRNLAFIAVRKSGLWTHKATHAHPVRMNLAARGALDLESVVERVLLGVVGLQIRHAAFSVSISWPQ